MLTVGLADEVNPLDRELITACRLLLVRPSTGGCEKMSQGAYLIDLDVIKLPRSFTIATPHLFQLYSFSPRIGDSRTSDPVI